MVDLYKIIKFDRNRIPRTFYVFADNEEDSWVKSSLSKGKRDSVEKICNAEDIYNIDGLIREINILAKDKK